VSTDEKQSPCFLKVLGNANVPNCTARPRTASTCSSRSDTYVWPTTSWRTRNTPRRQRRAARDFDAGAQEKKLRDDLQTWRDLLERDLEHGRVALRQMLHEPIRAKYFPETDT
jgi:hypothetical protein